MKVPADERYMRLALAEAERGVGHTSPNPPVGAVIVKGGRILSRGFHRRAGGPHAEIEALRGLRSTARARGATLYVTLEPCSTHGRTGPCTDAILRAGIRRVVVGCRDPNPAHAGRGLERLREAGVRVRTGVCEAAALELIRPFGRWITTGRPWVIAKWAMTLDGFLTRPPGEPGVISSAASRRLVHRLRARVDAVWVGAGTVRTDDPRLTVRGIPGARQPWRVVLTRSGALPAGARLFTDEHRDRTLVFRGGSPRAVLDALGRKGVVSVLVEGGGSLLGGLFDAGLVDEVWMFLAPRISGGGVPAVGGRGVASNEAAHRLEGVSYERVGGDVWMRGCVVRSA